jgi:hypothetical protein
LWAISTWKETWIFYLLVEQLFFDSSLLCKFKNKRYCGENYDMFWLWSCVGLLLRP